jgi:hypothetical protein
MAAGIPFTSTWRDKRGFTSLVRMYYNDASATAFLTAVPIITADLAAMTNAGLQASTGALAVPVVYGATGQFQDIEDKAVFVFQTTTGSLHRYHVPAPKAAIFAADLETVNLAFATVATFITDMLAQVASRDGEPLTTCIGGMRLRGKKKRRINIFTQNPTETGPDE